VGRPFRPGAARAQRAEEIAVLNDDRVGRAPEALFDADRASLLTGVRLRAISEFSIDTHQLHNDSTSISVHGTYRDAVGTRDPRVKGRRSRSRRDAQRPGSVGGRAVPAPRRRPP
jgi:hypothetical protein